MKYIVLPCSYKNGREAMGKSQYEKAVICFSKAITLQPEQVLKYLVQRVKLFNLTI